jgi:hypothetical protein
MDTVFTQSAEWRRQPESNYPALLDILTIGEFSDSNQTRIGPRADPNFCP